MRGGAVHRTGKGGDTVPRRRGSTSFSTGWCLSLGLLLLLAMPSLADDGRPAAAKDSSGTSPAAPGAPPDRKGPADSDAEAAGVNLDDLLARFAEKAKQYETIALRFICIESIRGGENLKEERRFDYMYVEAQEQRYMPYRQRHTDRPTRGVQESAINLAFPDSYSWTLMFLQKRQHIFHFRYVGQEWFSLRLAYVLEFTAPLPFISGQTIYEWSGRVWIDSENYNFLKVEASPGNQEERLKSELKSYRESPRFLVFAMGHKPRGSSYNITFLNEFQKISLPDQAEYRGFSLDLDGNEEWEEQTVLRYTGYRFYNVDAKDLLLKQP
jgi:hypothetical protein